MRKLSLVFAATVLMGGCGQKAQKGPDWDRINGTGSAFVLLLAQGKTKEAYLSASQALRSNQTEAELASTAKKLGLTPEYDSTRWGGCRFNAKDSNRAVLNGSARSKNGNESNLRVKLVNEGTEWRVLSVGPNLTANETARSFVLLLAQGKMHDAYVSASSALRSEQTEAEFTAAAKKLGLTPEFVSVGFGNEGDFDLDKGGTLIGSAGADGGREIPLVVKLEDDGDGMAVRSVSRGPAVSPK